MHYKKEKLNVVLSSVLALDIILLEVDTFSADFVSVSEGVRFQAAQVQSGSFRACLSHSGCFSSKTATNSS